MRSLRLLTPNSLEAVPAAPLALPLEAQLAERCAKFAGVRRVRLGAPSAKLASTLATAPRAGRIGTCQNDLV